jgi:hypothetical protein
MDSLIPSLYFGVFLLMSIVTLIANFQSSVHESLTIEKDKS